RSDLYALACVLYEMLAGEPPFRGPTVQDVVRQHLTVEARSVSQLRPAVPAEGAEALNRAFGKAPADRFKPAGPVSEALGRGTPVTRERPTRKPGLLSHTITRTGGVVILLALGALALLYLTRRAPRSLQLERRNQVTLDPGLEIDPALSPDGKFVAYS